MKNRVQGILIGLIIGCILTTVAFASPLSQMISVVFDDYKFIVNGTDKSAFDADARPFNYNSRIYVPLRYVGEALGMSVNWDADTKTVYMDNTNMVDYFLKPENALSEQELQACAATLNTRLEGAGFAGYILSVYEGEIVVSANAGTLKTEDLEQCVGKGALSFKNSSGETFLNNSGILRAYPCYDDLAMNTLMQHYVEITLTPEGREAVRAATAEISVLGDNKNYITITLDDTLLSAPFVNAEIDSDRVILTGYFTKASAAEIASVLSSSLMPCSFTVSQ